LPKYVPYVPFSALYLPKYTLYVPTAAVHFAPVSAKLLKLRETMNNDKAQASESAIGPAYKTPLMPKTIGNTMRSGNRNAPCRDSDSAIPCLAFPVAVK
jgi:hypothetical protein